MHAVSVYVSWGRTGTFCPGIAALAAASWFGVGTAAQWKPLLWRLCRCSRLCPSHRQCFRQGSVVDGIFDRKCQHSGKQESNYFTIPGPWYDKQHCKHALQACIFDLLLVPMLGYGWVDNFCHYQVCRSVLFCPGITKHCTTGANHLAPEFLGDMSQRNTWCPWVSRICMICPTSCKVDERNTAWQVKMYNRRLNPPKWIEKKASARGTPEWQLQNLLVPNKGNMMSQPNRYRGIVEFEMHVCHSVFGGNSG